LAVSAAHILAFPDSPGALDAPDATGVEDAGRPFDREEPAVRALVSAAQAGDQDAFGQLVAPHERAVYRTALAALGRREDAQEAAQEALLVAWRKLPGFRGEASFKTWLLTIAWRKALDRRRVRALWWRRTQWAADEVDAPHPTDELSSEHPTPERSTVSRDLARRVEGEIRNLSPKLRDALLLASAGEYSYAQIASMLAIPVGTLKWRVVEARRVLIERLGPEVAPHV
jgi:RNA polymerase sigma-70 factor (ECF subfamily)